MHTAPPRINHRKRLQVSFNSERAQAYTKEIERLLGISQSAIYCKLNSPASRLSIAEKEAIAKACGVQPGYLFPEMDAVKATQ